jgi:hypothetical protein
MPSADVAQQALGKKFQMLCLERQMNEIFSNYGGNRPGLLKVSRPFDRVAIFLV